MSSEEHSTESNEGMYFFDTYALVEIYEGNASYAKFADKSFFITKLNLFELHQYMLRTSRESFADSEFEKYVLHAYEFSMEVVKEASKFRKQHKGKNLSMTDCIGYILAKEKGLVFLTGDCMFEGLENVKFVK